MISVAPGPFGSSSAAIRRRRVLLGLSGAIAVLLVVALLSSAPVAWSLTVVALAALSAYAAVVVAFLGGIHWGFGFRQDAPPPRLFIWGVVPAIVASVALVMQPSAALVIHGVMLVACYLVDRRIYPQQGAARWLVLRFRLTGVAALACFLGAAGG